MEETFLDIDAKHINEQKYSFDMGRTLTKLVYMDTRAHIAEHRRRFRIKVFPSNEPSALVEFVNSKYPANKSQPRQTLVVTGVSTVKHRQLLEQHLHVRLQVTNELEQFGKAFSVLLSTYTPARVFSRPSLEAERKAMKVVMDWAMVMQKIKGLGKFKMETEGRETVTNPDDRPPPQEGPPANTEINNVPGQREEEPAKTVLPVNRNMYNEENVAVLPCLHVLVGSNIAYMKVDENGQSSTLNGGPVGGKYFMGLARLATGIQNFSEMLELAQQGHPERVDLLGIDAKDELGDADDSGFYQAFPDDQTIYGLGKLSLDDAKAKKEDILASLFTYVVMEMAKLTKNLVQQYGLKRIYFTGAFLAHDYTKNLAEAFIATYLTSFQLDSEIKYGFIKNGHIYGALGCLLKTDKQV